jgi:hypothetical protein
MTSEQQHRIIAPWIMVHWSALFARHLYSSAYYKKANQAFAP